MFRSPNRLLALAAVIAVTLILILQQMTGPNPEHEPASESSTLVRTTLELEPPAGKPIPDGHPSHPSSELRPPYAALSPNKPIHKAISSNGPSSDGQFLHGTISLGTGSPLVNQSFEVELILYRPKPDVIYSGVITTDNRGGFSIFVGEDYLTTTSISLHASSTTKAYRTGLFSTTHIAQAPKGKNVNLGYVVLFDAEAIED